MADDAPPPLQLKPESHPFFFQGISLVLSRWTALQMAVINDWGGRNSRIKSEQLAWDIFSWFTESKETLYIDDLEDILAKSMIESFSTEVEDGSDEEVAEKLLIMHEEFLHGNYESVEKLMNSKSVTEAVSQSRQIITEDDGESSDDEASDMLLDEQKPELSMKPTNLPLDGNRQSKSVQDDDGWSVVPSRKNRVKKH